MLRVFEKDYCFDGETPRIYIHEDEDLDLVFSLAEYHQADGQTPDAKPLYDDSQETYVQYAFDEETFDPELIVVSGDPDDINLDDPSTFTAAPISEFDEGTLVYRYHDGSNYTYRDLDNEFTTELTEGDEWAFLKEYKAINEMVESSRFITRYNYAMNTNSNFNDVYFFKMDEPNKILAQHRSSYANTPWYFTVLDMELDEPTKLHEAVKIGLDEI